MYWRYLFTVKRGCFQTVSKLVQKIFIVYVTKEPYADEADDVCVLFPPLGGVFIY